MNRSADVSHCILAHRTVRFCGWFCTVCFSLICQSAAGAVIELRELPQHPKLGDIFNDKGLCEFLTKQGIPCPKEEPFKIVRIDGAIESGDDVRLAAALVEYHKQKWVGPKAIASIYVNSLGGDVEVALRMGRLIRQESIASVVVEKGQQCLSACVLLVAAGKERYLDGVVGIHRMFFTSSQRLSYEQSSAQRRGIESTVKSYLKDMNVSPDLYDAMDRIDPADVRVLGEEELERYGLLMRDPVHDEMLNAAEADRRGISRVEYNQRSSLARQACVPPRYESMNDRFQCHEAVLSGKKLR